MTAREAIAKLQGVPPDTRVELTIHRNDGHDYKDSAKGPTAAEQKQFKRASDGPSEGGN